MNPMSDVMQWKHLFSSHSKSFQEALYIFLYVLLQLHSLNVAALLELERETSYMWEGPSCEGFLGGHSLWTVDTKLQNDQINFCNTIGPLVEPFPADKHVMWPVNAK